MAKPYRIKELEKQHPNLEKLIVDLVNEGGQALASRKLNVSQTTISHYLLRAGYRPKTIYLKQREEQAS